MKKLLLGLLLATFCFSTAFAAHGHFNHHFIPPRPAPVIIGHPHHDRWESFFAGLVGSAIGSYMVTSQYRPTSGNDSHCIIMQSRLTGNIVKKCINLSNSSHWRQQDIYDILYID